MKKRKIKRNAYFELIVFLVVFVLFISAVIDKIREEKIHKDLTQQSEELKIQLKEITDTKEELHEEKTKLEDDNYLESILQGKYQICTEEQQIFILPEIKD